MVAVTKIGRLLKQLKQLETFHRRDEKALFNIFKTLTDGAGKPSPVLLEGKYLEELPVGLKPLIAGLKKPKVLIGTKSSQEGQGVLGIAVRDGNKTTAKFAVGIDTTGGKAPVLQYRGVLGDSQNKIASFNALYDSNVTLNPETCGIFTGKMQGGKKLSTAIRDENMRPAFLADSYVDSNPAVTITKTVFADLLPPIIEDPTSSFLFGKVSIFAEVNEPTMAILHFGLNSPNEYTYTNTVYSTYHEFNLTSLTPGEYSYFIEVIDLAGNQSINDNSGSFFKFNAGEVCNILLVDSFQNNSSGWFEITPLPLSGYTDCLDELGYQYDVWSYSEIGTLPLLEDLTSYNIVIWRANDLNYLDLTSSTIIPEEQLAAITEYVANGGNFFLSSMEILSYSSASFYQQVLHVQTFSEDTQVPSITGTPGTSIGNNISISLDYSNFPNLWILESDLSDTFVTTDDAAPIFSGPQGTG